MKLRCFESNLNLSYQKQEGDRVPVILGYNWEDADKKAYLRVAEKFSPELPIGIEGYFDTVVTQANNFDYRLCFWC